MSGEAVTIDAPSPKAFQVAFDGDKPSNLNGVYTPVGSKCFLKIGGETDDFPGEANSSNGLVLWLGSEGVGPDVSTKVISTLPPDLLKTKRWAMIAGTTIYIHNAGEVDTSGLPPSEGWELWEKSTKGGDETTMPTITYFPLKHEQAQIPTDVPIDSKDTTGAEDSSDVTKIPKPDLNSQQGSLKSLQVVEIESEPKDAPEITASESKALDSAEITLSESKDSVATIESESKDPAEITASESKDSVTTTEADSNTDEQQEKVEPMLRKSTGEKVYMDGEDAMGFNALEPSPYNDTTTTPTTSTTTQSESESGVNKITKTGDTSQIKPRSTNKGETSGNTPQTPTKAVTNSDTPRTPATPPSQVMKSPSRAESARQPNRKTSMNMRARSAPPIRHTAGFKPLPGDNLHKFTTEEGRSAYESWLTRKRQESASKSRKPKPKTDDKERSLQDAKQAWLSWKRSKDEQFQKTKSLQKSTRELSNRRLEEDALAARSDDNYFKSWVQKKDKEEKDRLQLYISQTQHVETMMIQRPHASTALIDWKRKKREQQKEEEKKQAILSRTMAVEARQINANRQRILYQNIRSP